MSKTLVLFDWSGVSIALIGFLLSALFKAYVSSRFSEWRDLRRRIAVALRRDRIHFDAGGPFSRDKTPARLKAILGLAELAGEVDAFRMIHRPIHLFPSTLDNNQLLLLVKCLTRLSNAPLEQDYLAAHEKVEEIQILLGLTKTPQPE